MIPPAQGRADLAVAVGRTTMVDVAATERWRHTVRSLPLLTDSDEFRVALRGLSAWHERLCVDGEYAMPGPADWIEALHHSAQVNTDPPTEEITFAWWAVRVAEEVVECRRLLASREAAAISGLEVALARLDRRGRQRPSRTPA